MSTQPPQWGDSDRTQALNGPGRKPADPDATQAVRPQDPAPEATQVVRPNAPGRKQFDGVPLLPPVPYPGSTPPPQPAAMPLGYPPAAAMPPGYPPLGVPGYPAPQPVPTVPFANWGLRFVAGIIDYGLFTTGALVAFAFEIVGLMIIMYVAQGLMLILNTGLLGGMGQSLGKKAVSIKLVRAGNGQPPGFLIALGRALLHVIDALPLLLGFIAPAWDDKRQTFADKIVATVVVKASQYGRSQH